MNLDNRHIIEIPDKGKTFYIPKELAFCNPTEFRGIALLLYNWQKGDITYHEFRVQALYKLLNLKKGKRKINSIELEAAMSNIDQISFVLDSFFHDDNSEEKKIKLNIIDNPVPYVRPVISKICGPKARLSNTNWGQYEDASNDYHMYHRTYDEKYLYQLFARYYQNPDNYNKDKIETKATYFKNTLDFGQIYSFFLFFEAFQNHVTSSKVLWEGKVIDLSILFSPSTDDTKSPLPGLGTKSLSFQIAESGVFGDLKELRKEKLWEIFLRLYDMRKRDLDAEAQQKKKSNT